MAQTWGLGALTEGFMAGRGFAEDIKDKEVRRGLLTQQVKQAERANRIADEEDADNAEIASKFKRLSTAQNEGELAVATKDYVSTMISSLSKRDPARADALRKQYRNEDLARSTMQTIGNVMSASKGDKNAMETLAKANGYIKNGEEMDPARSSYDPQKGTWSIAIHPTGNPDAIEMRPMTAEMMKGVLMKTMQSPQEWATVSTALLNHIKAQQQEALGEAEIQGKRAGAEADVAKAGLYKANADQTAAETAAGKPAAEVALRKAQTYAAYQAGKHSASSAEGLADQRTERALQLKQQRWFGSYGGVPPDKLNAARAKELSGAIGESQKAQINNKYDELESANARKMDAATMAGTLENLNKGLSRVVIKGLAERLGPLPPDKIENLVVREGDAVYLKPEYANGKKIRLE